MYHITRLKFSSQYCLKSLLCALLFFVSLSTLKAQTYPQNYFRNPLDIPIGLSGSFGELRFNHFHSGFDIRTNSVEGLPVYAAAEGWISRIRVQGFNYGNALYISHPNGYTTLYAHMKGFAPNIQNFVKSEQYRTESFEQDISPDSEKFHVTKGQLIGYSGNSGASRAPHLHFEIRETITDASVNPMLFFKSQIKDFYPPSIRSIKIYPLDSHSFVRVFSRRGKKEAIYGQSITVDVGNNKNHYGLSGVSRIEAHGTIGFGIRAVDYYSDHSSTLAAYSIDLYVNKKRSYHQALEKVVYARQHYINAHTDYAEFVKFNKWFERSYRLPNDSLDIYGEDREGGKVNIKNDKTEIEYIVKDLNDSPSVLPFTVYKAENFEVSSGKQREYDSVLYFDRSHQIVTDKFKLNMPRRTLYDDMKFAYSTKPQPAKAYSEIYKIDDAYAPFIFDCDVCIKADKLPEELREKACIVSDMRGYLGGEYANGWVNAKTKSLGCFYIMTDNTAPNISSVNLREGANMSGKTTISFHISDNLSGIKSFRGTIDGKWILFKYDSKKSHLWYDFDEHCPVGHHTLELTVTDNKNNSRTEEWHFRR